ncbi:MAG: primosomal protein N' [Anaerolineales bacterium]
MYAEVAVNLAGIPGTFHYHIPDNSDLLDLQPGHLITVPFSNRRAQGIVVAITESTPVEETKPVESLLDPNPVLTRYQIELARWMGEAYHASIADCLSLMLPPGLKQRADSEYGIENAQAEGKGSVESRLLALLRRRGPLRGRQIDRSLSRMNWQRAADRMVQRGELSRRSVLDPPRVSARRLRTARLAVPPERAREAFDDVGQTEATLERRRKMLEALIEEGEPLDVTWVYAASGGHLRDLRYLEDLGLIALGETEVWRDPLEHVEFVPRQSPTLTREQREAWRAIQGQLAAAPNGQPVLLHGVTGSGKTELYMRAVDAMLAAGLRAIVLVPEIALTPQTVRRFLARFPGRVGLIHSQLSEGERYDTWRRARRGLLDIVIGPRSALFSPLPDIGLLVLDESHDESYKEQSRSPRYHARETSLAYARILGASCILGSATPDVVTSHRAQSGELQRVALPNRIMGHRERIQRQAQRLGISARYQPVSDEAQTIRLPPVRVIDMRVELKAGNTSLFSRPLQAALTEVLESEQQAILFLNRRGSSTYVFCRDCGWVARCPRCDRPLTHHAHADDLLCHHCGYRRSNPLACPECGGHRVRHFGAGTERIQQELQDRYPGVRALRWDTDSTQRKGSHEVILAHFQAHRADVLVGTQMVAKGLDLPLVTLVGVISADTGLNLPDYRANERTFQLLTQVAGRAGRGLLGGQVLLQTYHPTHYAIEAAADHDYDTFYRQELSHRRDLGYPPFTRMARLIYRHTSAKRAEQEAKALAAQLQPALEAAGVADQLIGPVPCFFERIRGQSRWQLVIRANDPTRLLPDELPTGWTVDIDPVSLL